MTMPIRANVVACQATAEATWRFTNPSTFRSPISRRRRDTLTTRRWASVAAPNTANMAPKMSGKLTASPKLTREVGVMASAVVDRYGVEIVVDRCLSPGPDTTLHEHPAAVAGRQPLEARCSPGTRRAQRCSRRPAIVITAPVPRLTAPPSTGKETCDTTRNVTVRLLARRQRHGDVDERAHMRTDLAHRRRAEADLIVADRKMPVDGREEERAADGRAGDGPHRRPC